MVLSEMRRNIISGLAVTGVSKESIIAINLMLEEDEQMDKLILYIQKIYKTTGKHPTESDLLKKALEIKKETSK